MPTFLIARDGERPHDYIDLAEHEPWELPHMNNRPNDAPPPAEACTDLGTDEAGPMEALDAADLSAILWCIGGVLVALGGAAAWHLITRVVS